MEKQLNKMRSNNKTKIQTELDSIQVNQTFAVEKKIRHLIQSEFIKRCKKNNAYSLRAFAQYLEIDQSYLSKILRGHRSISEKVSQQVCLKLGIRPSTFSELSGQHDGRYFQMIDDEFNMISDWTHFAIIELIKTNPPELNDASISDRLGLHIEEVRGAIVRLQRIGYLRIENQQMILNSPNNTWSNNVMTTEARKILQKKLLEMAIEAVDTIPFALRDHGSLTVAINKNRIPEFKEKLKQIRRELGEYFQSDHELDEVYQLTVAFFPLTKIK